MKKLLLLISLCIPLFLYAQDDKDPSDMSLPELAKIMGPATRALKTAEDNNDKTAICHVSGHLGAIYLAIGHKIAESDEKSEEKQKQKANFVAKSIDYCKKS